MFNHVHKLIDHSRDQKLVWLQGGKGFVYSEDQPGISAEPLHLRRWRGFLMRNAERTTVSSVPESKWNHDGEPPYVATSLHEYLMLAWCADCQGQRKASRAKQAGATCLALAVPGHWSNPSQRIHKVTGI
eukprot:742188-Rhodomonas_salina.2